jgi:hypothetical protein
MYVESDEEGKEAEGFRATWLLSNLAKVQHMPYDASKNGGPAALMLEFHRQPTWTHRVDAAKMGPKANAQKTKVGKSRKLNHPPRIDWRWLSVPEKGPLREEESKLRFWLVEACSATSLAKPLAAVALFNPGVVADVTREAGFQIDEHRQRYDQISENELPVGARVLGFQAGVEPWRSHREQAFDAVEKILKAVTAFSDEFHKTKAGLIDNFSPISQLLPASSHCCHAACKRVSY